MHDQRLLKLPRPAMDDNQEIDLQRLKWVCIAAALFLLSGFASITELRQASQPIKRSRARRR